MAAKISQYGLRYTAANKEGVGSQPDKLGNTNHPGDGGITYDSQEFQPMLLTIEEASQLLRISVRKIQRMKSLGRFPKEIRIGGSVRWRRHDVEQWIADGCPKLDNRQ
ncbi:helix-turn-helix transcriptional regulator [Aeoliella sp. SH292]|uniref:helix-turn-helix transcriptional regulator n=1 Tax=Aeoliella sp. SH292 TaxID=3454464 RepID=UPI003F9BFC96